MNSGLLWELTANVLNTASILLAGRNRVHTWWTGILGCAVFARVFYDARLYADVVLQFFFIAASAVGWWRWARGNQGASLPVRHTPSWLAVTLSIAAMVLAWLYGQLLHHYTDAYAPHWDSLMLTFSVVGQFLLVGRRVESWWCWLVVNTVAVPLFISRGLHITAVLYAGYWVNAVISLRHWQRLARQEARPA